MSIEKDIRFIAESIEWQNKLLAKLLLDKEPNDGCNKSERCNDECYDDDSSADQIWPDADEILVLKGEELIASITPENAIVKEGYEVTFR